MAEWALQDSLYEIQTAFEEILQNYPIRWMGPLLRIVVLPLGRSWRRPDDRLGHRLASFLMQPSAARDRLSYGAYVNREPNDPIGRMELALEKVIAAEPLEQKLEKTLKLRLDTNNLEEAVQRGVQENVISSDEAAIIRDAAAASLDAILTDEFPAEYLTGKVAFGK